MPLLHIANINFEEELAEEKTASIEQALARHEAYLQLQFLPLLYVKEADGIGVTNLPQEPVPASLHLLSAPGKLSYSEVSSWGYSKSVAAFAKKHGLSYAMPPWEVVRAVNSKEFSFSESSKLPGAELLFTIDEVQRWWEKTPGPKVLKSCFGFSGRGHAFDPKLVKTLPVIGEPWVERDLDFSTQWEISKEGEIEYIGATICISNAKGQYVENRCGNNALLFGKYLPLLEEHLFAARAILQKIARLKFFGNVGIDAMIFSKGKLHPIVEVNARKTMGWVSLFLQRSRFPKQTISLSYCAGFDDASLLPQAIIKADGTLLRFRKQLRVNSVTG